MTRTYTTSTRRTMAPQARETADVQRYLRALFDGYQPGALIEVRSRYRGGMRPAFFKTSDTFTAARTIVRQGLRSDVYVGVAARHRRTGDKHAINEIRTLWADLDTPDARAALKALPVAPAIVIASGTAGHLHAYWPLQRPIAIATAESANRRLAAQLHADTGAVTNAATILRPPGTYSFKTDPPTPVVLERLDDDLTTVYAATAGIADDPTPPPAIAAARPALVPAPRPGEDPLRALEPAHYVSALTGQPVGRSRKISCPFHEDRTPSFHVYERPEDGWFCFGCKAYGHTAYDLASALWSLQTRGEDFLELRARLYALFLPGQTPPAPPQAVRRRRT
jgi:CHC2 zinc finger